MREIHIKPTRTTRICSVRGCGNRDTILVCRSRDMRGSIRVCRECATAMAEWFSAHPVDIPADNTADKKTKKKTERETE